MRQEEIIQALLKVTKGECQIGHAAELAGGETHSGHEDYDAADSFERRGSREADQSEGPRAHYLLHSIQKLLVTFPVWILTNTPQMLNRTYKVE